MALDIVYVLLLVCWGMIALGFYLKDYPITTLGTMFLIVWCVHVLTKGIMGYQDLLTNAFGVVNLGAAAYILIRGGMEGFKDL